MCRHKRALVLSIVLAGYVLAATGCEKSEAPDPSQGTAAHASQSGNDAALKAFSTSTPISARECSLARACAKARWTDEALYAQLMKAATVPARRGFYIAQHCVAMLKAERFKEATEDEKLLSQLGPAAFPALVALSGCEDPIRQQVAAAHLHKTGFKEAVFPLSMIVLHTNDVTAMHLAATGLGSLRNPAAVPVLAAHLFVDESDHPRVAIYPIQNITGETFPPGEGTIPDEESVRAARAWVERRFGSLFVQDARPPSKPSTESK